jgi:hypothetical protein
VKPEEFTFIARKFGLDSGNHILANIKRINDSGRGQELERALTKNEIKNELWTWLNTP